MMSDAVPIIIYARTKCHLCDEAEATIREVADEVDITADIDLVNINSDEELREEYGERVPHVYVDGRPTFKFRVDAGRLGEKLTTAQE